MDIKNTYSYEYNEIIYTLDTLMKGIYYNPNLPGHNDRGAGSVETNAQKVKALLNMMAYRIEKGNTDPIPALNWRDFIE